jgi:hypothetical protein
MQYAKFVSQLILLPYMLLYILCYYHTNLCHTVTQLMLLSHTMTQLMLLGHTVTQLMFLGHDHTIYVIHSVTYDVMSLTATYVCYLCHSMSESANRD